MNENICGTLGFLIGIAISLFIVAVCDRVSHDVRVREFSDGSRHRLEIPDSLTCTGFTYELGTTGGWVRVTYDVKH